MLGAAWAVFRKELLEALRDRRTVILGLLTPVLLMPVITLGLPYLAVREEAERQAAPARVAVVGETYLRGFLEIATAAAWVSVVAVEDPRSALREGAVEVVLEARAPERTGAPPRVRLLYDESSLGSTLGRQKVAQALARYSLDVLSRNLEARGVAVQALLPFQVEEVALARPGPTSGPLLVVLPFFMAVWMLLGGQYAALDVGAGERERGTLPALLVTPPPRLALVLGKFLTVLVLAMGSVVLVVVTVLVSLWAGAGLLGQAAPPSIPLRAALLLVGVAVALAAFLTAVELFLSLWARTVREAQQLFTPLYLLVVAAVVLAQVLPEWGRQGWVYAVPVLNAGYLLRAVLQQTWEPLPLTLSIGGLLAMTAGALAAGAGVYRREGHVTP